MGSELIFALLGIAGKVGGFLITNWLQSNSEKRKYEHEKDLAYYDMLNRSKHPVDAGFDNASDHTRWTRRVLGLALILTVCTVQWYCINNAGVTFTIPTLYEGGIFDWLFGTTNESSNEVSLGYIAYKILDLQFMCGAFYFTPVGRSTKQ